jgi:hypothetical protein
MRKILLIILATLALAAVTAQMARFPKDWTTKS